MFKIRQQTEKMSNAVEVVLMILPSLSDFLVCYGFSVQTTNGTARACCRRVGSDNTPRKLPKEDWGRLCGNAAGS